MENRPSPPAIAAPRGSRWRTLGHWLFLLLIAFDLVTAPFHRHGHDLGVARVDAPLPHGALAKPAAPLDLASGPVASSELDDRLELDSLPAASFTHSQALLRPTETRQDDAAFLDLIPGLALLVATWALLEAPRGWPRPHLVTAPAKRPAGLLPDGRAPPLFLG